MNNVTSSGLLTSSGVVLNMPGALHTIIVIATSGTTVVTIYDSATGPTGKVLHKAHVPSSVGSDTLHLTTPAAANEGLYMSISGPGAEAIVHYTAG